MSKLKNGFAVSDTQLLDFFLTFINVYEKLQSVEKVQVCWDPGRQRVASHGRLRPEMGTQMTEKTTRGSRGGGSEKTSHDSTTLTSVHVCARVHTDTHTLVYHAFHCSPVSLYRPVFSIIIIPLYNFLFPFCS